MKGECYIVVDVEASGPIPGEYSMLSLGACAVDDIEKTFYCEFRPISERSEPKAMEVCGLSLEKLMLEGRKPAEGMADFATWISGVVGEKRPVFVAFNATFDWMFVAYYFHRFLGRNPFGISGLDIKAYFMGMMDTSWGETAKRHIPKQFLSSKPHTHNARDDAVEQADIFRKLLAYQREHQAFVKK